MEARHRLVPSEGQQENDKTKRFTLMKEDGLPKAGKRLLLVVLIVVLCASLFPNVVFAETNHDYGFIEGPYLLRWEQIIASTPGLKMWNVDVERSKLYVGVPFVFCVAVWNYNPSKQGVRAVYISGGYGDILAADVRYDGGWVKAYGSLHWHNAGPYLVSAKVVFYDLATGKTTYVNESYPKMSVTVVSKPMMSDEEGDSPLDGPWMMNDVPVPPSKLAMGVRYKFHCHLYHISYYVDDLRYGVKYQYNFGTGPTYNITVPLDGKNVPEIDETGYCTWNSTGNFLVKARAGWYVKPNQNNVIAWSDWDSFSVTVSPAKQLTVHARSIYEIPLYVPLSIDGYWWGNTGSTYTVSSGSHQIYVQFPPGYLKFEYYYYDGIYNYNNPMTLSITSSKTVIAYCSPYY